MVLGEEDPSDVTYEKTADLIVKGKSFENQNVYGDKKFPDRRTIIPGNDVRSAFGDSFPKQATVEWMGEKYPARLSFRYSSGGGSVPVYEYWIGVKSREKLMNK